jgi:hypothetical protein
LIEEYRKLNNDLMEKYKSDKKMLAKHKLIKGLLNDNKCFFKISIEDAFSILRDLEIPDNEIEEKYKSLISYENFKNLED